MSRSDGPGRTTVIGGRDIALEAAVVFVQNATDQAKTTTAHIVGCDEPYAAVPRFRSHQYGVKLRTVGISTGTIKRSTAGTDRPAASPSST